MTYNPSKTRVVKNTAFLYARTLLLMVIGVFTSRITLQALGVDGYGTVNVVSGFVGLFALISGSLTGACQRFLTYEMGAGKHTVREVFNASLKIHIILAVILILVAETVGLYIVQYKLNIPPGDSNAVQWVYQTSVIAVVISLLNIPYNALIISYERLNVFAYFSLLEGALKFIVVFLLLYIDGNKLIIYSVLTLVSSIIIRIAYQIYTRRQFSEDIKFTYKTDKALFKSIFGFAGWTFLGNAATICSNQGVNIVLNLFCGVVVNAARGIAVMIENVIISFVNNFTTALNPQITKTYASNEHEQLIELVRLGVRITLFLMLIIAIPVIYSADELLHIWFVDVPDYSVSFVRLTLIVAIIQAVGNPFLTLLLASGKIRNYQVFAGVVTFLNLPGSYVLLNYGFSPVSIYLLAVAIALVTFFGRLVFIHMTMKVNLDAVYFSTIKLVPAVILFCLTNYGLYMLFSIDSLLKLILFGMLATMVNIMIIYALGISNQERSVILTKIRSRIGKIR